MYKYINIYIIITINNNNNIYIYLLFDYTINGFYDILCVHIYKDIYISDVYIYIWSPPSPEPPS